MSDLLHARPEGLFCEAGGFHVDPWSPVPLAVITHAHADHARPGSERYVTAEEGVALLRRRLGDEVSIEGLPYGEPRRLGDVTLSLHPAGHVRGSAQVLVERDGERWVVTGDLKRAADPTCAPFEVVPCDVLITEATFGLPIYRWGPTAETVADIVRWWDEAIGNGRNAVLFCYTLGKAQRLLAELKHLTDRPVLVHGAVEAMTACYRDAGVEMAPTVPVATLPPRARIRGEIVLAPLPARGTAWMKRFGRCTTGFASGLMRVRGERRRRGFDRGFVLSDHADWPALLRTVEESGARRVLATHGHGAQLARYLASRGLRAEPLATRFEGEGDSL